MKQLVVDLTFWQFCQKNGHVSSFKVGAAFLRWKSSKILPLRNNFVTNHWCAQSTSTTSDNVFTLDKSFVNAWIIHCDMMKVQQRPQKNPFDPFDFQMQVIHNLMERFVTHFNKIKFNVHYWHVQCWLMLFSWFCQ